MPPIPFLVSGFVRDTDGITGLEDATVIIINLRTKDKGITTTAVDGSYSIDLGDVSVFPNGYLDGDDLYCVGRKTISTIAEKYAEDVSAVAGAGLTINFTTVLHIDKSIIPLSIDFRDVDKRTFEPNAKALRVVPTTPDGMTYSLFARRTSPTTWSLVLPNGNTFGSIDASGNLHIDGEVFMLGM